MLKEQHARLTNCSTLTSSNSSNRCKCVTATSIQHTLDELHQGIIPLLMMQYHAVTNEEDFHTKCEERVFSKADGISAITNVEKRICCIYLMAAISICLSQRIMMAQLHCFEERQPVIADCATFDLSGVFNKCNYVTLTCHGHERGELHVSPIPLRVNMSPFFALTTYTREGQISIVSFRLCCLALDFIFQGKNCHI